MRFIKELALRARAIGPILVLMLVLVATLAVPALAQESFPGNDIASQSLRPYRFVFIAYALAWVLVLGWVVSVARRLGQLSRRLGD